MKIKKELQTTVQSAIAEAKSRHHEYVTLEHLLLALCADPAASAILEALDADLEILSEELEEFLTEKVQPLPSEEREGQEPKQTLAFWRVLQRAAMHVEGAGKEAMDGGSVLISLLRERDCHAVELLERRGITRLSVLRYVSHGVARVPAPRESGDEADHAPEAGNGGSDPLEAYAVNLREKAGKGLIDPLIGRQDELLRIVQVLSRRRKNNPVLVGEPGVGKTALVEGLALAIHEGKVPQALRDAEIYSLDMGALLAGTRYRGDFEERVKAVVKAITGRPKAILFIDEIHMVVGAGATSGGSVDASNLLKPALASGELRCIGSTTYREYKASFEKDRTLERRFQRIEVAEPSVEDTIGILKGLRGYYEEHHGARYTDEALEAAARLAAKHINDRFLPDKAIDVIDEAGAKNALLDPGERKEVLGAGEIEAIVAKIAKIPEKTVSVSDEVALARLEPELKAVIYGQDRAVETLVSAIKLSRAGLGAVDKPIGSFLFSGPTGVGKTELAKQMARILGVEFMRYDMSEYMEKHTVSRLIGAPPGYVGFDQGGLLTDAIRKTPYAVLLLDEIEKAHPDVFNILLQVMDHATLTDNNGRKADFRHVILILTTNAGARDLVVRRVGYGRDSESSAERSREAIEQTFSPEFRNRLDAWVAFDSLAQETVEKIVDKLVGELAGQLGERNVTIDLTPEARSWLAEKGFDRAFGARPMARLIQNEIKRPLADRLLFGDLKGGGRVRIEVQEGKLHIPTA
jgi:ATP-dependent Clp protease ATP-binding subunit ClpA